MKLFRSAVSMCDDGTCDIRLTLAPESRQTSSSRSTYCAGDAVTRSLPSVVSRLLTLSQSSVNARVYMAVVLFLYSSAMAERSAPQNATATSATARIVGKTIRSNVSFVFSFILHRLFYPLKNEWLPIRSSTGFESIHWFVVFAGL